MRHFIFIHFRWLSTSCFLQQVQNVLFLDQWTDSSFSAGPEGVRFNEIYTFEQNGNLYAVIGSSQGAHFCQIVNESLRFVDFVPGKYQGLTAENRDYANFENYLYAVCDEGLSSLQIMDLSYLPDSVSLIYDSNIFFNTAHTLCADTLTAKLYVCGANNAAMKIFDISDPINPVLLSDFNAVSYVHDCHVVNDTAFLNCGFDGLKIYNFSGPVPVLLGQLDFYANQGYNHSGYFADSKKQYAFTDETEGTKIKLCYLDNFADIKIDQEFGTEDYEENVPHEIVLLENLLFCAYYNEGLRIYDLSSTPVREIGSYDTYLPDAEFKMNGTWGVAVIEEKNYVLVSDRQSGLFLFWFPVNLLENGPQQGSYVNGSPFIDGNRYLIPRPWLDEDNLYFSVSTVSGDLIYTQENYLNWVAIPLNLSAGVYIYSIFQDDNIMLETGKFVVG